MNENFMFDGVGGYYLLACDTATPPHIIEWLTKNENHNVRAEAFNNPNCPFRIQFLRNIEKEYIKDLDYNAGDKISQSRYAVARRDEYEAMLAEYNLTVEEADSMPYEWLVGILSD